MTARGSFDVKGNVLSTTCEEYPMQEPLSPKISLDRGGGCLLAAHPVRFIVLSLVAERIADRW